MGKRSIMKGICYSNIYKDVSNIYIEETHGNAIIYPYYYGVDKMRRVRDEQR